MKWIPLGPKEPPMEQEVLIWAEEGWAIAYLSEKRITKEGTVYQFEIAHGSEKVTIENPSHFAYIEGLKV